MEDARHPLGVLPLTMSVDGSDAALALRMDVKPTTDHWIIEADSTWLTADSEVFEEPIVKVAEDVNGSPSTRVVSCTLLLSYVFFNAVVVTMIGMEGVYVALRALKDRTYSTVRSTRGSFENSAHTNAQHS